MALSCSNEQADYIARYFSSQHRLIDSITDIKEYRKTVLINQQTFTISLWYRSANNHNIALSTECLTDTLLYIIFLHLDQDKNNFARNLHMFCQLIDSCKQPPCSVAIGINLDQERAIEFDEAKSIAKQYGMGMYAECSAETGENINEAFEAAFEYAINKSGFWQKQGESYTPSPFLLKHQL